MNGIEINGVSKSFGSVTALQNVSLRFEENKIYGLLGRNGAGKTTLLNITTGRIFPDVGEVLIDGERAIENDKALKKLFYIGEATLYPENMTIGAVFRWTKRFFPDFNEAYAVKIARQFELGLNKTVKSLSTGFNSIFKLVLALSVNTPYLFLDEPVLGLDANNRDLFYRLLLEKYSENPCTVIISTHLIEEVASVFEDIVVLKDGAVIVSEPQEALLSRGYTVSGTARAVDSYTADKNVIGADSLGGLKTAYILGNAPGNVPEGLEISQLNLQKLFIQLTNSQGGV